MVAAGGRDIPTTTRPLNQERGRGAGQRNKDLGRYVHRMDLTEYYILNKLSIVVILKKCAYIKCAFNIIKLALITIKSLLIYLAYWPMYILKHNGTCPERRYCMSGM